MDPILAKVLVLLAEDAGPDQRAVFRERYGALLRALQWEQFRSYASLMALVKKARAFLARAK